MNYLESIINSMSDEDSNEFQSFIHRNRYRPGRKDLELFNLLFHGKSHASEIMSILNIRNNNAYHTLRKRLYQHVSDFILLKSKDQDASATARVNSLFTISKYFFEKGLSNPAWRLLLRAEKIAQENELFDNLNGMLLLQIEQCHLQEDIKLEEVINKYEQNSSKLKQSEKIILAQSKMKDKVFMAKKEGHELSFDKILTGTLTDFKMIRLSRESPKILFSLLNTMRQWVIVSKEFYAFEPLIEKSYHELTHKENHFYLSKIILMLAHTKYRNKKFSDSISYLNELESNLSHTSVHYQNSMNIKSKQLRAANLIFLDQLDESIFILNQLLNQRIDERDKSNVIVNLGIYHFFHQDHGKCLKLLNSFPHTEKWYKNHMGIEWLLKRDLMTVLLHNDSGDKDLAESKIKSIERKYVQLFQQERYKRAKTFLTIIKQVVYSEELINMTELEKKVEVSWEWVPYEEKDLQAMMFYAWLRGKILKISFYNSLVDLVKPENEVKNYRLMRR